MSKKKTACSLCPFGGLFDSLQGSEAGRHLANAGRELLLSIRSLIDEELERAEKKPDKKRTAKRVKIIK